MVAARFIAALVTVTVAAGGHVCQVGDIVEALGSDSRWHQAKVAECLSHGVHGVDFEGQSMSIRTANVRPVQDEAHLAPTARDPDRAALAEAASTTASATESAASGAATTAMLAEEDAKAASTTASATEVAASGAATTAMPAEDDDKDEAHLAPTAREPERAALAEAASTTASATESAASGATTTAVPAEEASSTTASATEVAASGAATTSIPAEEDAEDDGACIDLSGKYIASNDTRGHPTLRQVGCEGEMVYQGRGVYFVSDSTIIPLSHGAGVGRISVSELGLHAIAWVDGTTWTQLGGPTNAAPRTSKASVTVSTKATASVPRTRKASEPVSTNATATAPRTSKADPARATATTTATVTATSTSTHTTTETTTRTSTHTSSTATVTFTTTSTTTEYCFVEEVSWEPLDMKSTDASKEVDELACQRRCLQTEGCFHFSFWKPGSLCHLQDILSVRREASLDYVSGPFQCWSYLEDPSLIRQSKDVFIPKQLSCMEIGVTFTPAMTVASQMVGDRADRIATCQSLCRLSVGCEHFSLEVNLGACSLSAAGATALPGSTSFISGRPVCGGSADKFMQKKFSPMEVDDAGSKFARSLCASVLVVGLFLGVVPVARQIWRGASRWRSARAIQEPQEPLHGDSQVAAQLLDDDHAEDGDVDME